MNCNYLLVCLLGILANIVSCALASEAILGGRETSIMSYRYLVSLLQVDYGHMCGGTIIGERHILTAAHCFINPDDTFKNIQVYALIGTNDLMQLTPPSVNLEVVKIYVPKEYNATDHNTTGDIAVLELEKDMNIMTHSFKRAFLQRNRRKDYSGEKATVAGWGWNHVEFHNDHAIGHRSDSFLRFATADVLDHEQCQHDHSTLHMTQYHLCARIEQHEHEKRGVCWGDDGGPLIHQETVIGVLSKYSKDCTERTKSAIYTRVWYYIAHIRNSMRGIENKNMRTHELKKK